MTGLAGVSMGGLFCSQVWSSDWSGSWFASSDQPWHVPGRHALSVQESQPQNDALAIADLLRISEAQRGLDLVAVGRIFLLRRIKMMSCYQS